MTFVLTLHLKQAKGCLWQLKIKTKNIERKDVSVCVKHPILGEGEEDHPTLEMKFISLFHIILFFRILFVRVMTLSSGISSSRECWTTKGTFCNYSDSSLKLFNKAVKFRTFKNIINIIFHHADKWEKETEEGKRMKSDEREIIRNDKERNKEEKKMRLKWILEIWNENENFYQFLFVF